MEFWFNATFWVGFINILILDLILSGDNAVVIGMAAYHLPEYQRKQAVILGAGAAVLLRAALTAMAAYLLKIPFLMTIGGVLLLWIAVKLLIEESKKTYVSPGKSLRSAVKTIMVADIVMSLDNVLAVAGVAHGDMRLVLFGLIFSIPIIMWGSNLVALLIRKLPGLIYLGSVILGYTAGQLIVEEPLIRQQVLQAQPIFIAGLPVLFALLVVLLGWIIRRLAIKQKNGISL
jgi:YjbE family integral membrane protein